MKVISDREVNTIRGKCLVGHATTKELLSVFTRLDTLESMLDELDAEDAFGTEGWRHRLGLE